jgi:hypothetical protein
LVAGIVNAYSSSRQRSGTISSGGSHGKDADSSSAQETQPSGCHSRET